MGLYVLDNIQSADASIKLLSVSLPALQEFGNVSTSAYGSDVGVPLKREGVLGDFEVTSNYTLSFQIRPSRLNGPQQTR
jgi:hypothetical protein